MTKEENAKIIAQKLVGSNVELLAKQLLIAYDAGCKDGISCQNMSQEEERMQLYKEEVEDVQAHRKQVISMMEKRNNILERQCKFLELIFSKMA